jgi:hypothetical protein
MTSEWTDSCWPVSNVHSKCSPEHFFIGEETLENRTVSGHEVKFSPERSRSKMFDGQDAAGGARTIV